MLATITPDIMDITKLIDDHGDEIYALALMITKDFDSAKQVFVKLCSKSAEYHEDISMTELAALTYKECEEADSNEGAVTLTGVDLDSKRQAILEKVLVLGETKRAVIHMFYENDLSETDIAAVTGQTEKHITDLLNEIPAELVPSLEKHYKEICTKIKAEDKLKAYVIRAVTSGNKRLFEVKNEAVPVHRWKTEQKIIIVAIALIITSLICFVIPLAVEYYNMREREGFSSYENLSSGESFYITEEAAD